MYCPKCGKAEQKEKTFCRNCGEFLPDLSRTKGSASFGGDTPEDQIKVNLVLNLLSALVSLFFAVALYVTFHDRDTPTIVYLAAAFLLAMSAWQFSTFYIGLKLKKHFSREPEVSVPDNPTQASIKAEQSKKSLNEADFESIVPASVTENTTKTLSEKLKK